MTAFWLFLGFLTTIGVALVVAADMRQRGQVRVGQLSVQLHDAWAVLTSVQHEAQAQLDAGDPNFDYLIRLINDADVLPRKELPR